MKLRVFKIFIFISLLSMFSNASNKVFGIIFEEGSNTRISNVSIYDNDSGLLAISDSEGYYEFYSDSNSLSLFYSLEGRK